MNGHWELRNALMARKKCRKGSPWPNSTNLMSKKARKPCTTTHLDFRTWCFLCTPLHDQFFFIHPFWKPNILNPKNGGFVADSFIFQPDTGIFKFKRWCFLERHSPQDSTHFGILPHLKHGIPSIPRCLKDSDRHSLIPQSRALAASTSSVLTSVFNYPREVGKILGQ